jgi:hypothetical protein
MALASGSGFRDKAVKIIKITLARMGEIPHFHIVLLKRNQRLVRKNNLLTVGANEIKSVRI